MASEPAWACVASSAFPLVYSYSKELTLGGQSSRNLEKDHSKLIQALEQQLKVKGRSAANKAETLFFYSHFPFLTSMELDLVLLRLSEQFCASTYGAFAWFSSLIARDSLRSSTSFRVAILALIRRLQVHFPGKSITEPSKITTPFAQLVAQHDLVETRILTLQVLAILAPFARDDQTVHSS
ncbi:hypothetical protein DYB32_005197 [Aphanomyces invadans]|uniref:Uncharacterized protein n=1 Tax=Aphanomyces invadans TaxID=157072 RepID=A0A418AV79_9STRA|nr:hypothetical protein DYB32_005197 [Aphanomyces invadans]